ncbi:MAG: type II secretion system protein [Prosthecobacter sp.]|uniref:type II secretion system protein n=1 Tax=Prosthecobacter sp. TaxID=1965333 RepID=UPI003900D147
MKQHSFQQRRQRRGFTLLEVVIVLAIVALLLSVIYSIMQGTLTLADNIRRTQQRDSRQQAFTAFCEHLFLGLPATAALNLQTTQEGSAYLSKLELYNISSPFDGSPGQIVTLQTETLAGGGLRMILTARKMPDPQLSLAQQPTPEVKVVLFDSLAQCEWRAFDPASKQWAPLWREPLPSTVPPPVQPAPGSPAPVAPLRSAHPLLLELKFATGTDSSHRQVFWIAPNEPVVQSIPQPPSG